MYKDLNILHAATGQMDKDFNTQTTLLTCRGGFFGLALSDCTCACASSRTTDYVVSMLMMFDVPTFEDSDTDLGSSWIISKKNSDSQCRLNCHVGTHSTLEMQHIMVTTDNILLPFSNGVSIFFPSSCFTTIERTIISCDES